MKAAPATNPRRPSLWNRLRAPVNSFKATFRRAISGRRSLFHAAAASTALLFSSAVAATKRAIPFGTRPALVTTPVALATASTPTTPPTSSTRRRISFSAFSPFKIRMCPAPSTPITPDRLGASTPPRTQMEPTEDPRTPPKSEEEPPSTHPKADVAEAGADVAEAGADVAGSSNQQHTSTTNPGAGQAVQGPPYWKTVGGGQVFEDTSAFKLSDDCTLFLHRGDITKWAVDQQTDAIVNAANERMLGGGGVDGAIHRAAGPELLEMCRSAPQIRLGVRCPTGSAVTTGSGRLPAHHVIHTVGPIYEDEEASAPLLTSAYKSSMEQAQRHGVKFVAFPAISCGIYGYPLQEGADVSISTVKANCEGVKEVHFVLFGQKEMDAWLAKARSFLPQIDLE